MDSTPADGDMMAFARQVRARSDELQQAVRLLVPHGLPSVTIGLLRLQLDSLVRVMFLLAQPDLALRAELVAASVDGRRWEIPTHNGRMMRVTDRMMVEVADTYTGWSKRVYEFGCSFVHLSSGHDHLSRDPFQSMLFDDRRTIVDHLNHYHRAGISVDADFVAVARLVPAVMDKISTALADHLKVLEDGGNLPGVFLGGRPIG